MTPRPAPTLTVPEARRRVESHWHALTAACRDADEGAILEQLATFQTLIDAGSLRVLGGADPMAPIALCHQLRRLRNQLVQHTTRVKRASGTIALGGGCLISPSIALLAGFPWGLVGLGCRGGVHALGSLRKLEPVWPRRVRQGADSLIARIQATFEE